MWWSSTPRPDWHPLSRRGHSQPRVELPVAQEPDITWTPARGSTPGASWWCDNPQLLPHSGAPSLVFSFSCRHGSTRCAMPRDWDDGEICSRLGRVEESRDGSDAGMQTATWRSLTNEGASCDGRLLGLAHHGLSQHRVCREACLTPRLLSCEQQQPGDGELRKVRGRAGSLVRNPPQGPRTDPSTRSVGLVVHFPKPRDASIKPESLAPCPAPQVGAIIPCWVPILHMRGGGWQVCLSRLPRSNHCLKNSSGRTAQEAPHACGGETDPSSSLSTTPASWSFSVPQAGVQNPRISGDARGAPASALVSAWEPLSRCCSPREGWAADLEVIVCSSGLQ